MSFIEGVVIEQGNFTGEAELKDLSEREFYEVPSPFENGTEANCSILDTSRTLKNHFEFVFAGLGILFLALFGISANVLSVIVLKHPGLKSSLTTLLLGLTISDIFVVGTSLLLFSLPAIFHYFNVFLWYSHVLHPFVLPWLLPIALIAQMSSLYFTVMITLERYIAVLLPLKARSLCTRSTSRNSAIGVILVSVFYNIPRWFEYKAVPDEKCNNSTNQSWYEEKETDFRRNPYYIDYYVNWSYFVVIYLIPFTILILFNSAIYREMKKRRSKRNSLCPGMAHQKQVASINEDIALAGMLLAIVITFIACNMLALVINVMESFKLGEFLILIPISNFLIVFGCTTNFVFYCVFGTKFRRRLIRTLGIKPKQPSRRTSSFIGMSSSSCRQPGASSVRSNFSSRGDNVLYTRQSPNLQPGNNNSRSKSHLELPGNLDGVSYSDKNVISPKSTRSDSQITVQMELGEDV